MSSFEERADAGRVARKRTPRSLHGEWSAPADRVDPVSLLEEQALTRLPELVPIRYGRMMVSPLTFYRGAALLMAADLSSTPTSGLLTQLCGDAHLSNFGLFGTPERALIFDLNDFDETLPGPWEWDVKRLAASFEIAGRGRGFSRSKRRETTLAVGRAYRQRMRHLANAPILDAWYDRIDAQQVLDRAKAEQRAHRANNKQLKRSEKIVAKARTSDSMAAFTKLVRVSGDTMRIIADLPLIEPLDSLVPEEDARTVSENYLRSLLTEYGQTLPFHPHPLSDFEYVDTARKVVGVGSVGTRALIVLLRGRDRNDPLLLQVKEAEASVLERFLGASKYQNHGKRVVLGQRQMQAASDIFLGWQRAAGIDGVVRDFYVRQLKDWKGSVDVDKMVVAGALLYAQLCGETLARAHSRTGDRVAIAAYLGSGDRFDQALADFSESYADQNERDYAAFEQAIASGRLHATPGL